jgi:hypothetical protein
MAIKYSVEDFIPAEHGLAVDEVDGSDILKQIERNLALDIEEATATPDKILRGRGDPVHVGFDTEYEFNPETFENDIVLYCFYLIGVNKVLKGCIRPDGFGRKYRWTFKKLFGNILHIAKREGVVSDYPSVTYIYSHFIRADVASWSDFWDFSHKVKGVAGTVTGPLVRGKECGDGQLSQLQNGWGMGRDGKRFYRPEPIMLSDCGRRGFTTYINFVDTIALVPGRKGLDFIGKMLGAGKGTLPEGHHISRYKAFDKAEPLLSEEYCLQDAMLTVIYGLRIQQFCLQTLGLRKVPTTIGGIAVALFKKLIGDNDYFNEVFGIRYIKSQQWDGLSQRVKKRLRKAETVSRRYHSQFFIDGFSGGINISLYFGPTPLGVFNDEDLVSAYVIGMLSIYPLDYAACYETKNPEDFCGELGLAHIAFKFKESDEVALPCFAVRTETYGLVFPSEGECYATAPEIENGLNMGAEIIINHGVIVPQKRNEPRIFEQFVRWVRENRTQYDNNGETLLAEFVKSIGNTLFGKCSTLNSKGFFDTETGDTKKSSPSPIANPYIASHITGFVRATLSEAMNGSAKKGCQIISGTTDGYLSTDDKVDLSGPLCTQYQALCDVIDGGSSKPRSMLKRKHWVKQIMSLKTRCQLTGQIADDRIGEVDKKIVLAKGSVKLPKEWGGEKLDNDVINNDYMMDLTLNRYPGQKVDSSHFISMREQWYTQSDLIMVQKKVLLNLEYDMKRKPVNPRMVPIRQTEHLAFDTVPWDTVDDMEFARSVFDGWRKPTYPKKKEGQTEYTIAEIEKANSLANCLKNLDDYYRFEDFYLCHLSAETKKGINVQQGGSVCMLKRLFLIAYKKGKLGLASQAEKAPFTQAEVAEWLSERGYQTTVDDVSYGGRKGVRLVSNVVPVTRYSLELLMLILSKYPNFEYLHVFSQHIAPGVKNTKIALEVVQSND